MLSRLRALSTLFSSLVLVHALAFMAYWLTNSLFYASVNDYLSNLLKRPGDYIAILLVVSALIALWSAGRLLLYRGGRRHPLSLLTGLLYTLAGSLYLAFFYGGFAMLFDQSPVQAVRVAQLALYFRLLIDPLIWIALVLLAALLLSRRETMGRVASTIAVLLPLAFLWTLPLLFPADSVYRGNLPPKPRVIAHRGASFLAPENTLAAFDKARQLGTFGVESDLALSADGAYYLMHDDTLKRTTNIAQVFPGRESQSTGEFTLAQATSLNAGEWFVQTDPYGTIRNGQLTADEVARYRGERVPTLAQWLDFLKQSGQTFIFDIKEPAGPRSSDSFEAVLQQIHGAGIDSQAWFLVTPGQIAQLRETAPEMKAAYGEDYARPATAEELVAEGYQVVNAEYGLSPEWIKRYHDAGLWVNLYTIDEPWQYSRLWLLGVDSTTSSNAGTMMSLASPILAIPYATFALLWAAVGVVGLALFALLLRTSFTTAPAERAEGIG